MKRAILILCLTIVGLVALPVPASAGIWAWLEEMSGPGPFKGVAGFASAICFPKVNGKFVARPSPFFDRGEKPYVHCIYVDISKFEVDANSTKGYPKMGALLWDAGPSVRIDSWLDLGVGIGQIGFQVGGETHKKTLLTPVRVVVRPLLLLDIPKKWRPLAGVLNLYVKETFIKGPIDGTDFGVAAAKFSSDGELRTSGGIILDLTGLFNWKYNK